ncbi:unnamed protein product [Microthlaspi erraticum]|uniref:Transmembrane protein n=1 Tax=Microthlaspi erraticum TaxID=1685480 RepID=A0A6D2I9W3_9BRAS|nr:unnamed protein product [Microthlaspi erraticum]
MKLGYIILALLMVGIVSGEVSPAPAPIEHYLASPKTEMSPAPSSPTMSPFPGGSNLNHTDVTGMEGEESSGDGGNGGGKMAGIAVGAIAAASMVGVGGYVLKKRRENIRRSRYEYAATEIF